jgi:hypothetical protein
LLDNKKQNPKTNALELGQAFAEHLNKDRSKENVAIKPPGKSTVGDWLRSEQQIRGQFENAHSEGRQGDRSCACPLLEDALQMWFHTQHNRDLPVTDALLRGQAETFAKGLKVPGGMKFSDGWPANFKKRHGMKRYTLHVEAGDANEAGYSWPGKR